MRMTDIIMKKRNGFELSDEEISFFIKGIVDDSIPDYQISALLMTIFFNGMTERETFIMTFQMSRSGDILDLSGIMGETVDKHSTGGVGDKTTLIVAPIAAAIGCKVAKLSGRGLSHTGGTVDKLESIRGFDATLSPDAFINQVNDIGICVAGQSGNLAPADKKLYALRDVTCTVESLPLIASSVMSKKLAASAKNIMLDVKTGSGAFMKDKESACELAKMMIKIGKSAGKNIRALVTDMDSPLGNAVGNSLEVIEAVDVLCGRGPSDLTELCIELAAGMYSLCFSSDNKTSRERVIKAITDLSAFEKFCEMVKAQGGDVNQIKNTKLLSVNKNRIEVFSNYEGYITGINSEKIGRASVLSGAGREKKNDVIDYSAGIIIKAKVGDFVKKGDLLAIIFGETHLLKQAEEMLNKAYSYGEKAVKKQALIIDRFE